MAVDVPDRFSSSALMNACQKGYKTLVNSHTCIEMMSQIESSNLLFVLVCILSCVSLIVFSRSKSTMLMIIDFDLVLIWDVSALGEKA